MEFSYNNALSAITSISLFFANKVYHPNISIHSKCNIASSQACNFAIDLNKLQSTLKAEITIAQQHYQNFRTTWPLNLAVVATTRQNGTCDMLTSAKLLVDYLVVGITRELNKEPLLHCSSIYINTMWSMLQQCLPALKAMHHSHVLLLIHHKTTMPYTYALTSYS